MDDREKMAKILLGVERVLKMAERKSSEGGYMEIMAL